MIAGLVLAPLSRPAMAGMASGAAMAGHASDGDEMAGHAMDDMTMAEMATAEIAVPSCPSKAPTSRDCDRCLSMTGCGATFLPGMPTAVALLLRVGSDRVATSRNDFWPDGLDHSPPDHPPRILV
ncbi:MULTISPECIES: hypothetical protein [Rhodopseudomonas]|uniref:Uncharacterized protein n=1 Tax=Rhodopseudomonas palustris TaxID=1076 RepID=A0A0D7F891_RHOPL|nr:MULTISPECIES: hypothetical protein [Rhodopseudomonas]KIZ47937.1 hypothetical protein OO17_01580 [Rhodopseudomonas palustris]MDF3810926.1 hypothetical protein [Rhodopseudomonas sp. BAL398]WOK15694.1 hypothetical protein RBJ75_16075 [Rhodopseudomonas sp. BAL398]